MTGLSTLLRTGLKKAGLKNTGKTKAKKDISITKEVLPKILDDVLESKQSITEIQPPVNTVKAYKLFTVKKGKLYPLFLEKSKPIEMNKWLGAVISPGAGKGKQFALRPGWHTGELPIATHIGGKIDPKTGLEKASLTKPNVRKDNQVWAEVELPADKDWQSIANSRARIKKDGTLDSRTAHITDEVPYGGTYKYKTNPNMTGSWLISGEMKVNRILPNEEVKAINNKAGVSDLPRVEEFLQKKKIGGMVMRNDNYNTQRAI